jgi:hypothetical protein
MSPPESAGCEFRFDKLDAERCVPGAGETDRAVAPVRLVAFSALLLNVLCGVRAPVPGTFAGDVLRRNASVTAELDALGRAVAGPSKSPNSSSSSRKSIAYGSLTLRCVFFIGPAPGPGLFLPPFAGSGLFRSIAAPGDGPGPFLMKSAKSDELPAFRVPGSLGTMADLAPGLLPTEFWLHLLLAGGATGGAMFPALPASPPGTRASRAIRPDRRNLVLSLDGSPPSALMDLRMSEILSGRWGEGGLAALGGDCLTTDTVGCTGVTCLTTAAVCLMTGAGGGGVACFSAVVTWGVVDDDPVFLRKMPGDLGPCRTLEAAALMLAVAVLIAAGGPFFSSEDLPDPPAE